jgi:hypothetical protein
MSSITKQIAVPCTKRSEPAVAAAQLVDDVQGVCASVHVFAEFLAFIAPRVIVALLKFVAESIEIVTVHPLLSPTIVELGETAYFLAEH